MTNLINDPRITAIGLFTEVHSGLTNRFAAQFDEHHVSAVEFEVLMRLARSPGRQLRMTDLASQTSLSTSGVTRVVDRMERSGLLTRSACPTDRRSSYAVITDAGLARLDETLPGHLALIDEFFTGLLDADRLGDLLSTLRVIRDAANPGAMVGTTDTADSAE
ncbi:MarR family winged helix-turn-helix transcriptional regulator [Catenuloplanes atrovinosus]|uniref:DNA-binding MarR family transcriptional regulator n=1 Tax=Catenuloplanes atrovinosus TaxID=137266 RepID=A0AAE3YUD7_9ACTN|nr:MarR family transcriptional regulator [Catenuloplanes atrovinosus]MDR7280088.1 DNA-binding MarR family transcriptional regulator [Catenuloplanes atrovinosus]